MLTHLLLQAAVMISPSLPFATEPRRAEETSRLFALFLFGGIAAAFISILLPFVYARPPLAIAMFVTVAVATVVMEMLLRRRIAVRDLEFPW